jgi:hypothetical protein
MRERRLSLEADVERSEGGKSREVSPFQPLAEARAGHPDRKQARVNASTMGAVSKLHRAHRQLFQVEEYRVEITDGSNCKRQ